MYYDYLIINKLEVCSLCILPPKQELTAVVHHRHMGDAIVTRRCTPQDKSYTRLSSSFTGGTCCSIDQPSCFFPLVYTSGPW